jgi:tRNA (mo5U34)-methyltransferase
MNTDYFNPFFEYLASNDVLKKHLPEFKTTLSQALLDQKKHGDWDTWLQTLNALPDISTQIFRLDDDIPKVGCDSEASDQQQQQLEELLQSLKPWRKGPFSLFGVHIDSEWQCNLKWARILPHISSLENKTILDVGCGNGYYSLKMLCENPHSVVAIDPTTRFFIQFLAISKYLNHKNLHFLPIKAESIPSNIQAFDTVFSMGVLYHRKSPLEHLSDLKNMLKPDGELILETLVIEGDENTVLLPTDRYACMRNVWFIPSVELLKTWMTRLGYKNIRHIDSTITSHEEQRTTAWMDYRSLSDFLDPHDNTKTIEGYPAPNRATLIATK